MEKPLHLILKEIDRKCRVVDMMVSIHSILHQKYKVRTLIGSLFFLLTATILNVFTFFDYKHLSFLNLSEEIIKNVISISSFLIFLLSLAYLLLDWVNKCEAHKLAANQFSRMLNELRAIKIIDDMKILSAKFDMFSELYNQVCETTPKVPHNKFTALKAKHYQKVELSKFIDTHKGKPFFIIRILFLYKSIFTKNEN